MVVQLPKQYLLVTPAKSDTPVLVQSLDKDDRSNNYYQQRKVANGPSVAAEGDSA